MATLTDANIKNIKVSVKPTNYGVNQLSIGVADSDGNSSIVATGYSRILVARGINGHPYLVTATVTASTYYDVDLGSGTYLITAAGIGRIPPNTVCFADDTANGTITFGYVISTPATRTNIALVNFNQSVTLDTSGSTTLGIVLNGQILRLWNKQTNDALPALTSELSVSANYHLFDKGNILSAAENDYPSYINNKTFYAPTTNPGRGVYGNENLQGREAYYSVFIKTDSWKTATQKARAFTKDYKWYKETAAGSDYGKLKSDPSRSTLQQMLRMLPEYYLKDRQNEYNSDLQDFLSLFAFYYDTIKTNVDLLFDFSNPQKIDQKVLYMLLEQFGFNTTNLSDVFIDRHVMSNIIRAYKQKGSSQGLKLVAELFSGYNAIVATEKTNLIPDNNAANFIEGPRISSFWTHDLAGISTSPTVTRVSSPFTGNSSTYYTANSNNGVMKVTAGSSAASPVIMGRVRKIVTSANVTATTVIPYTSGDPRVGDYVINDTAAPYVPVAASIKSIDTGAKTVTLNVPVANGTIPSGTTLYLSSSGYDTVAAAAKMVPVTANTRYEFSFQAHAGGYTATAITPAIHWYDIQGTFLSANTSSAVTTTTNNAWYPVSMNQTSPANAAYAAPAFTLGMSTTGAYFFDAFMFKLYSATDTTYRNPDTTTITMTAYNTVVPYNTNVVAATKYMLKDYRVNGFIPLTTESTQSHTAYIIKDVLPYSDAAAMVLPNYVTGGTAAYSMATVVIQTGTNAITVGQSFSLSPSICASGGHGMIVGVISSTEYRVVDRSWPGATVYSSTTVATNAANIPDDMLVNVGRPASLTTVAY